MPDPGGSPTPADAARIARTLSGPVEAILGFQALLLDEVRAQGPADALPDLEQVARAANLLGGMIQSHLASAPGAPGDDPEAQARLRHDLRTPINAILGYSEMVLEDFGEECSPEVRRDIIRVLEEARRLSARIDGLGDAASDDTLDPARRAEDAMVADLRRSLARPDDRASAELGRILVIDDESSNRELLTRQLVRKGHEVRAVGSAAQTFAALEAEPFDLLLLDILMPDTNGIEVLARLKAHPTWRDIPVVMVSGLKETDAIVKCISAGAEDYLPKPIDPILLHARVDACLEKLRWRAREVEFMNQIRREKDRADALLHAMLPGPVIQRLNDGETSIADRFDSATILFADIVDFTPLVARLDPRDLVRALSRMFTMFDDLATRHGIEKIKTIGDAYMAAAGIPIHRADHGAATIGFARDMIHAMKQADLNPTGLRLRVGVHSGPVIAGLIGKKRSVYDVWGETVNLASRLEATGQAGRIHVSQATCDILGDGAGPAERRVHHVKGVGEITSYLIG
jgi:class 3 adenylate cyclase